MCYVLIFMQQDTKGATGNLYMDYLWWCVGEILTSYYCLYLVIIDQFWGEYYMYACKDMQFQQQISTCKILNDNVDIHVM